MDRVINEQAVVITEICPDLKFYAQSIDKGPQLEDLMSNLRKEFKANPPLSGAYVPKRGNLTL